MRLIPLMVIAALTSCQTTERPVPAAYYKRPNVQGWSSFADPSERAGTTYLTNEEMKREVANENRQRVALAIQNAASNISAQQAQQRYETHQTNQNTINYLQQRSLMQQQSQQNDLNSFRQHTYQRRIGDKLDNIERNTNPYRAY